MQLCLTLTDFSALLDERAKFPYLHIARKMLVYVTAIATKRMDRFSQYTQVVWHKILVEFVHEQNRLNRFKYFNNNMS